MIYFLPLKPLGQQMTQEMKDLQAVGLFLAERGVLLEEYRRTLNGVTQLRTVVHLFAPPLTELSRVCDRKEN